jgi:hypothetical protein
MARELRTADHGCMPVADSADVSDLPPALRARQARTRPADALGDLPRGAVAEATPATAPQPPNAAPLTIVRCYECAHVKHSKCARRLGTGPCLCYQCHSKTIIADTTRVLQASSDPRLLAAALQQTLILLAQRGARARRDNPEPPPARVCACGCGRSVVKTAGTGTRKLYATVRCKQKMQMRRYRARKRKELPAYELKSSFDDRGNPLPGTVPPIA